MPPSVVRSTRRQQISVEDLGQRTPILQNHKLGLPIFRFHHPALNIHNKHARLFSYFHRTFFTLVKGGL